MPIEQSLYDEIMNFVLQSVSSEEYLNKVVSPKIYRPKTMKLSEFRKIQKSDRIPGIYPIESNDNGVHYIGVNKQQMAGNGYLTDLKIHNSVGMDVQIDHSHGLCQTFALMYHLGEDNKLRQVKCGGKLPILNDKTTRETETKFIKCITTYILNVNIGLIFLEKFTKKHDMEWSFTSLKNTIDKKYEDKDHDTKLKQIIEETVHRTSGKKRKTKYYSLNLMIKNILLKHDNRMNLATWHAV